jgi:hypothetical protein
MMLTSVYFDVDVTYAAVDRMGNARTSQDSIEYWGKSLRAIRPHVGLSEKWSNVQVVCLMDT